MTFLIVFILLNYGIVITISTAKPLKGFREWVTKKNMSLGYLLACHQCLGLWVSPISYLILYREFSWAMIIYVFIGTASSYLLNKM